MILPSALKKTGYSTFKDCKSLKHITLPDGMEVIEKNCFSKSGIEEITIPSTVTEIAEDAFSWTQNLKKVVFAENSVIEKIGGSAFERSGLESFASPGSLKELG